MESLNMACVCVCRCCVCVCVCACCCCSWYVEENGQHFLHLN